MKYNVVLSLEAVEDVLRITMASQSKTTIIDASRQIQQRLSRDPYDEGEHLSEGLYFVDCEPLRAFFTVEGDETTVEIVSVRTL